MTTFTAYYDASGSEGDKDGVLIVVALVAHEYKWMRFEKEWREALKEFKVPYFHRKELGERKSGTGVYAKWKDDDETAAKFLRRLTKVMRRQTNKMFSCAMLLKDYEGVDATYRLRKAFGSPYVMTASMCYDQVNQWGRKKYPDDRGIHIFERGDAGQRDFLKLAQRVGHIPMTKGKRDKHTGEWFIPFQGADLVAGTYRHAANLRHKAVQWADYGFVFNELKDKMPQRSLVYDRQALLTLCKSNPEKCQKRTE